MCVFHIIMVILNPFWILHILFNIMLRTFLHFSKNLFNVCFVCHVALTLFLCFGAMSCVLCLSYKEYSSFAFVFCGDLYSFHFLLVLASNKQISNYSIKIETEFFFLSPWMGNFLRFCCLTPVLLHFLIFASIIWSLNYCLIFNKLK